MVDTDYDSPPRAPRAKQQNKKQYGKKARRLTVGVVDRMEKAGERQKKESSESEEVEKYRKGRREVENKKEGKGKGKEVVQREGRKRMSKVENKEVVGVTMTKGKTRARESTSSQRHTSSRSRKSQPVLLAPQASTSTSMQSTSLAGEPGLQAQPHDSTPRIPSSENGLALPAQINAQSSASDLETAPPIKRKRFSRHSLVPQNLIENADFEVHSRTSSIESLTSKFDKIFPPTSIQAYRASTVSPRLSAFSDKSNLQPSISASTSNIRSTQSTTNSPRLTALPPTLPRFTRSHSTRLSLSQSRASPKKSTSKLSVFQDHPIASTSRPSLPAPPSHSKRLSLSQFPSVSPSFAENTSKPTFRFTTTTFPDAPPSPTFALGPAPIDLGLAGTGGGKEAEGAGMESTFLLESWDANATSLSQGQVEAEEDESSEEEEEKGREIEEEVRMEEEKGGFEFADETVSTIRGGGEGESSTEMTVQVEEKSEIREEEEVEVQVEAREVEEAADESVDVPKVLEMPVVEDHDQPGLVDDVQAVEYEADTSDPSKDQSQSDSSPSSSPSPSPRLVYTASFLPPRRPRSPSHPIKLSPFSPPQIPSDEDDLAFLIRTTATHSSEDDLPPLSSDLSSDEREFQLAEREVGRGVKASSRQRGKRVEMREKLRVRGLKIGQGKEGRRLGWKREIIDLTGENDEEEEEDELALPSMKTGRGVKKEENVES